jgi:predicted RNA binding protein YcfA (HicA-like mRNA interferase family)
MPSKQVTVRELHEALKKLGFRESAKRHEHLLLQHPKSGLVLSLPTSERYVRLVVIRAIERSLENFKIVAPKGFQKMLDIDLYT